MKKRIISKIYFEVFSHATENLEKVKKSLRNLVPVGGQKILDNMVTITRLHGHYGNQVALLKMVILDKDIAQEIFEHIIRNLSDTDFMDILRTLDIRYDGKGNLFFRINKQYAFNGKLILDNNDDIIKVKISFLPHIRKVEDIKRVLLNTRRVK